MRIEDQRNETAWVPAISILEEFQPKLDQKYFIGIKKKAKTLFHCNQGSFQYVTC